MNILITGAKGFVGENLAAALKSIRDGKDRTLPDLKIEEIYIYDANSAYEEHGTIEQLDIEDDEITLAGYKKRYNIWLNKKLSTFNVKIREIKLQDQILKDNIHTEMKLREQTLKDNVQKKNKHFKEKSEVLNIYKNTVVFDSEDIGNFDFLDSTRKFYHGMTK